MRDPPLQSKGKEPGTTLETKKGTYVYQPISRINAPQVLDLTQLVDGQLSLLITDGEPVF